MDDANKYLLRQMIASIIDHPSVYMGGPSRNSVKKAIMIVNELTRDYEIEPKDDSKADVVRSWKTTKWDE